MEDKEAVTCHDHLTPSTNLTSTTVSPTSDHDVNKSSKFLLRCITHRVRNKLRANMYPPTQEFPPWVDLFTGEPEQNKMLEFCLGDLFVDLTWSVMSRLGYSNLECILAKSYVKLERWNFIPVDFVCNNPNTSVFDVLNHLQSFAAIHVVVCSSPKHEDLILKRGVKDKLLSFLLKSDLLIESQCPVDLNQLLGTEPQLSEIDFKEALESFNQWYSIQNCENIDYDNDTNNNKSSCNVKYNVPTSYNLTTLKESIMIDKEFNPKEFEGKTLKISNVRKLEHKTQENEIYSASNIQIAPTRITWRPAFEGLQREDMEKSYPANELKEDCRRMFDQVKMENESQEQNNQELLERELKRSSDSEMVDVDDLSDDEGSSKTKIKFQEGRTNLSDEAEPIKNEAWNSSQEIMSYSKRIPHQYSDSNFLEKYSDSFNNQIYPQEHSDISKDHSIYSRGNFRETPPAFFSPPLFMKEYHSQSSYPSNDANVRFTEEDESKMNNKKHSKTYQTSHTETHFSVNYISKWQNRKQSSDVNKKTENGKPFRNSGSPEFETSPLYSREDSCSSVRSLQRRYSKNSGYDQLQLVDQRRQHAMHSFQAAMSQAFNLHCLRHPAALFYPHQSAHASSSAFDPAKMLAVAAAVVGGGNRSGTAPTISPNGSQDGNGSSDGDRRKRSRVFIDPLTEIPRLERWFNDDTHPSAFMIEQFTEELNRSPYRQRFPSLEPKNVQLWFKNHRAKVKRQKLEMSCSASVGGTSTTNSNPSGGQMKTGMTF